MDYIDKNNEYMVALLYLRLYYLTIIVMEPYLRYFMLLFIVFLVLILFACSNAAKSLPTQEVSVSTDSPEPALKEKLYKESSFPTHKSSSANIVAPSPNPTPKATSPDDKYVGINIPYILNADWNYTAEDFISGIPEMNLEVINTLPVYKNKYPIGQEGCRFNINEDMIEGLKNNLITFLHTADINNYDNQIAIEHEDTRTIHCSLENDLLTIYAGFNGINISTQLNTIKFIQEYDNNILSVIKDTNILSAACKYLYINNPLVSSSAALNLYNEHISRYYTVYDAGSSYEETLYNRSFNYYKISPPITAADDTDIYLTKIDTSISIGDFKVIPIRNALSSLCYRIDDDITTDMILAAEILYTTRVIDGYYIPCYIFYVDEGPTYRDPMVHNYITYYYPAVDIEHLTDAMSETGEIDPILSLMNDYLNQRENAVFLLSTYKKVEDINLHYVFYDNTAALYNGFTEDVTDEERDDIAKDTNDKEGAHNLDVSKVTQAYADKLLYDKLGNNIRFVIIKGTRMVLFGYI